jgi:2-(1,2-epoxy-1,2-dihydrophenyl)acetyl-CoA isomerase
VAYESLLLEIKNRVATLTLNRPESLNATNDTMYAELAQALRELARDPEVGCVVLTGAGRAFCAGADVKAMKTEAAIPARRRRHRWILADVLRPLVLLEKPVIAAVNGAAVGAGFNIALGADLLIASEQAEFSQVFVKLGIVPDLGGLYLLTRVVGLNKAKELCFTGRKVDAAEGLALGFVNRVVPAAELLATAVALAQAIAAGPPEALGMTKMLLNRSSTTSFEQMLDYEGLAQPLAYATAEHREGVASFREKRAPDFTRVRE